MSQFIRESILCASVPAGNAECDARGEKIFLQLFEMRRKNNVVWRHIHFKTEHRRRYINILCHIFIDKLSRVRPYWYMHSLIALFVQIVRRKWVYKYVRLWLIREKKAPCQGEWLHRWRNCCAFRWLINEQSLNDSGPGHKMPHTISLLQHKMYI